MTKTEYIAAIEADLTAANNLCAVSANDKM